VRIALVHMGGDDDGRRMTAPHGLDDVPRVSDPDRRLYRAFELGTGKLRQVVGPGNWLRGVKASLLGGHGAGRAVGDVLQMPGVFLVHEGRIVHAYRHRKVADRPDYVAIARVAKQPREPEA